MSPRIHFSKIWVAVIVMVASCLINLGHDSVKAAACKDVEFIFARGSGERLGDKNYLAFRAGLETQLSKTSLSYDFYELGTYNYNGASYPAVAVGMDNLSTILTSVSATLSAVGVGAFNRSVETGVTELIRRVEDVSSSCANTKFVLAGYSQGAMVVSRGIRRLDSEKVAYLANFGDPNLYLPEGYGTMPPACRGEGLSAYRIYAPNCRAHAGILGPNSPYVPEGYAKKVGLWCTKKDIVCSNYFDFENPVKDHTSYVEYGIYTAAAKTIVKRALVYYPDKQIKPMTTARKRDTVFLFDTTGSMSAAFRKYASEALKMAQEVLSGDGRVALFEYRDLEDPFETRKVVDFGASYAEFETALENMRQDLSGGGDEPESLLSGALYAMNNVSWRRGATKSLVILTDAGYLNPDRDGTTLGRVVQRSLEIDPVNFYVMTWPRFTEEYESLAEQTGGLVFSLGDEASLMNSTEVILERPEVNFPFDEYVGRPGERFEFAVEAEGAERYEWDLDGDGVFETTTNEPSAEKVYTGVAEWFVQVRAIGAEGLFSTASTRLTVTDAVAVEPEVVSWLVEGDRVQFETRNARAVLVAVDGVPLVATSADEVTIGGLDGAATLTLTPIGESGDMGETKTIMLGGPGLGAVEESSAGEAGDGMDVGATEKAVVLAEIEKVFHRQILAPRAGSR